MLSKSFKIVYSILIILFTISIFQINKLPGKNEVKKEIFQNPIQSETDRDGFDIDYRAKSYKIKPIAGYELWGLVVSVNNINAWYNYYHDENTVNLKDVCVIWGDNIKSEAYLNPKTKIKNGEWTCYVSWWNEEGKIKMDQLSNNHLLTANKDIQKIIRNIHKGDQIHIKGSLADYAESGSDWYRKTSVSRTDTNQTSRSGGACEIVYVDELDILNKNQDIFYLTKEWSKNVFIFLIFIQFSIFIKSIFFKK